MSFRRVRRDTRYGADKEADALVTASGDNTAQREFVASAGHPNRGVPASVGAMETVAEQTCHATPAAEVDAEVLDLFCTEASSLTRLARFYLDDRTAAEDLVQEAFIRLSRAAGRIRSRSSAAAYLRSIVINLARDHNRRGLVSLRHRPSAVPDAPSAEQDAADRAEREEVIAALCALPRRQRDCVTLRYYLDLSLPEIGQTLGLSTNTVKTHLRRGLAALAETLEASR